MSKSIMVKDIPKFADKFPKHRDKAVMVNDIKKPEPEEAPKAKKPRKREALEDV
jgi:hypothetical protein